MATNFPTAIDVLINPAGTDPMSAHAAQHASANDAIEAIQAKVGVTGSTDTESLEFRVTALKGETTALDGRLDTVESVASAAMPSADHEAAHEVMGVVTAQTNPITGGSRLSAGNDANLVYKLGIGNLSKRIIGTRKAFNTIGAALGAQMTFAQEVAAASDFDYVRLLFVNSMTVANTIRQCKVAAAPNALNNGTALTWVPVTFNDAGASTLPPSASGSTATLTIPAATSGAHPNAVPSMLWSDWIPVSSIPRNDGGEFPILQTRTLLNTGDIAVSLNGANEAGTLNQDGTGLIYRGNFSAGDLVTTTSGVITPSNTNGWFAVAGVQFMYRNFGLSVATVGDSITQGQGSVTSSYGHISWGHMAVSQLIDSGLGPITYANWGYSGQNRSTSIDTARKVIAQDAPSMISFFPYSPNDGYTDVNVAAGWARTMAFVQECWSKGVVPMVCTIIPSVGLAAAADAVRIDINNRVRALSASGAVVVDFDAVITDGASPARIKAALSSDGLHPNLDGHKAMADVFAAAIVTAANL